MFEFLPDSNVEMPPIPQPDDYIRRWDLWEEIRFWGGALGNGICALMREAPESSPAPSTVCGHRKT